MIFGSSEIDGNSLRALVLKSIMKSESKQISPQLQFVAGVGAGGVER